MLTVCMMNDNFYRSSGSAMAIRRIAEAFTQTECYFAGTGDRQPEDLDWIPAGRYECFDLKSANPGKVFAELKRLQSWLRTRQCDLVHCQHRRLAALLNIWRIPVLYTGQNTFAKGAIWFRLLHPKNMTAVSRSVADNILADTGTRTLAVIGNPSKFPTDPPPINVEGVKKRAICIARLDAIKGHTNLLDAWKLLHERGLACELELVGEGPSRAKLERQARDQRTSHLIRFRGFSANVTSILETSLFAILVSKSEGHALVGLEAAAAGRPTLLTSVPGSVDLLPPDRQLTNGLPFGDVRRLADALQEWFTDPGQVVREGQRFFYFLKDASSPANIARQYEAVYNRVCSATSDPELPVSV